MQVRAPRYAREPVRGQRGRKTTPAAVLIGLACLNRSREILLRLGSRSGAGQAVRRPTLCGRGGGAAGASNPPQVKASDDRLECLAPSTVAGRSWTCGVASRSCETTSKSAEGEPGLQPPVELLNSSSVGSCNSGLVSRSRQRPFRFSIADRLHLSRPYGGISSFSLIACSSLCRTFWNSISRCPRSKPRDSGAAQTRASSLMTACEGKLQHRILRRPIVLPVRRAARRAADSVIVSQTHCHPLRHRSVERRMLCRQTAPPRRRT